MEYTDDNKQENFASSKDQEAERGAQKKIYASNPPLPENLQPLYALAGNTYWVWNRRIRQIFEKIDPAAWNGLGHNPVLLISQLGRERIAELSAKESFVQSLSEAYEIQRAYLNGGTGGWFQKRYGFLNNDFLVAYFSAEFAVAPCMQTYSGGLGVLSGDHLKSASDLGIPIVGIGLFYKRGYFTQSIDQNGWQVESFPENDPESLPVEPVLNRGSREEPLVISIPLDGRTIHVRAWETLVGRAKLYLLDTNLPGINSKHDCEITAELYGGDMETRIKQEIVLGMGGAKLLKSLEAKPTVFHMNEGHSSFVTLERIREVMEEERVSFSEAKKIVRRTCLFTTHTPVPAGIDVFSRHLVEKYLGGYCKKVGISVDDLMHLGHERGEGLNMAVLALNISFAVNAVSKLHREVANKSWKHVFDQISQDERSTPLDAFSHEIGSITNGIHLPSWVSDSMADLYDEYLGPKWMEDVSNPDIWAKVRDIPDEILWMVRSKERSRLLEFVSEHLGSHENGRLDPYTLTIGFARRFATYKRATLLLSDKERLAKLLKDNEKPIQFIFAGKAHPRDHEGKKLIQEIVNFTKSNLANSRVVFLSNYDTIIAKNLVSGVDVWLNNPTRPLEASGTSGMKATANGVLNLSTLDGWWDEAFSPEIGWAIGTRESDSDDADSLYSVLERQVIPEFYDERDAQGVPTRWVQRIKNSISTLCPRFNTRRMLLEYSQDYYFRDESELADRVNRPDLGANFLERLGPDWENHVSL